MSNSASRLGLRLSSYSEYTEGLIRPQGTPRQISALAQRHGSALIKAGLPFWMLAAGMPAAGSPIGRLRDPDVDGSYAGTNTNHAQTLHLPLNRHPKPRRPPTDPTPPTPWKYFQYRRLLLYLSSLVLRIRIPIPPRPRR